MYPDISASWGSWHLWPVGRETPFVWLLSLKMSCPLWSLTVCVLVSCLAQISQWWWVVLLVCRHPKTNCPCQWLDQAYLMVRIFMDTYLSIMSGKQTWVIWVSSTTSFLHTRPIYTTEPQHKHQAYSQTTVYTNTAGHTYSTQQLTPHCDPSNAQRGNQATTHGHISLLCLCKWSNMLQFLVYVTSIPISNSSALTFVLSLFCLTGWEEAQWPLWRKRLQRRL